jgi:hypothetical protein
VIARGFSTGGPDASGSGETWAPRALDAPGRRGRGAPPASVRALRAVGQGSSRGAGFVNDTLQRAHARTTCVARAMRRPRRTLTLRGVRSPLD